MSQQVTFTCDICGKRKGEANHWFKAAKFDDRYPGFKIIPWGTGDIENEMHLCGMECAVKAMTKAMQQ